MGGKKVAGLDARQQALLRALREVAPGFAPAVAPGFAPAVAPGVAPAVAPGVAPGVAPAVATSSGKPQHGATNRDRERRKWLSKTLRAEEADFIQGIAATATLLREARDASGEPVYPSDARHDLLAALERIGGWPSISELARALRVSKQAAREQVIGAARAGLLELLPDPRDRRSIQIGLTASAKRQLAVVRARQSNLVATLVTGLEARDRRLVAHVLRVIRKRLVVSSGKRGQQDA